MVGMLRGESRFTFAVVGRDEARTLTGVIEQAKYAARPGDEVWFVDSASRDESVEVGRRLGVAVINGGAGKGRAIATALARCEREYICFIDADLYSWETNIPAALRDAVLVSRADMVVGSFDNERRRMITPLLYWPLVDALFPSFGRKCDPVPLSGLRVLATRRVAGKLPSGYGVETYLNLALGAAGARIGVTPLGVVRDSLRGYSNVHAVGEAVITTILDFAVERGPLAPEQRPIVEEWARERLAIMAGASDADRAEVPKLAARYPFPRLGTA